MRLKPPLGAWREDPSTARKDAKAHLLHPRRSVDGAITGITVCKRFVYFNCDVFVRLNDLKPEDVCQRCLGPCEAES